MAEFLIIALVIFLLWPTIMKWVGRFMARRTDDYIRRATGMPPRPGSREARRQARARANGQSRNYHRRQGATNSDFTPDEPIIPREYAEDVDFVETKNYSESETDAIDGNGRRLADYHESQVSDAEWEEIKPHNGDKR